MQLAIRRALVKNDTVGGVDPQETNTYLLPSRRFGWDLAPRGRADWYTQELKGY